MAKADTRVERKRFLIGFFSFMGVFLLSYAWVLWITPILASSAGLYALVCFGVGVAASIGLIFTRHSLVGLGGSLASILFVVLFAFTWPLLH
ncbi:MAG: hypothetical protein HGA76_08375 [Candidatus Firestonebacteria bacterium]|nr:hypothetical protein [Candidatus Firestonebacteria bacterium]